MRVGPSASLPRVGHRPQTIAKYLAPAIAGALTPGGEPVTKMAWAAHIARWFPEVPDPGLRATTWPGIEVHRDRIP
jgi:hypothetical protein